MTSTHPDPDLIFIESKSLRVRLIQPQIRLHWVELNTSSTLPATN